MRDPRASAVRARLPRIQPMLATLVAAPFHRSGWIYEEKYDGDRILAYKRGAKVTLMSRNGKDRTARFPAIAAAIAALPAPSLVLDGEVVVFDKHNISRFQLLQKGEGKPVYVAFDCPYADGKDLRGAPLSARQEVLRKVLRPGPSLMAVHRLAANGLQAFRQAKRAGYEGLVAKDLASPYEGVRSPAWLKVKVHREDEFVIGGYTPPAGAREHFGALLLGAFRGGRLQYAGRVGTGFDRKRLAALIKTFRPLVTATCPFMELPPGKDLIFLKPRLVAQIAYQEITADGRLRQPVFLGLRDDKRAAEVEMPLPKAVSAAATDRRP